MTHFRIRSLWQIATILLACAFYSMPAIAANSTFQFVGNCTDCTGTATATLVLQNYTQGTPLTNLNFVSLTYSSNLLSFTLNQNENPSLSGTIPSSLPASASVSIFGSGVKLLLTQSSGSWCSGGSCVADFGPSSTWNLLAAPSAVPAPATLPLVITGLALVGLFQFRNQFLRVFRG